MKVAVTSQGSELDSTVDPRFGRARCFVVVDTDSGDFNSHDNSQSLNAVQGAGIQAGRNVIDLNVEAVITSNIGPKAFATLKAGGIEIYTAPSGTVADAVEKFKAGELECVGKANVDGHGA